VAKDLGVYKIGHSLEDKLVTVEVAARARAARVKKAMQANRRFNVSTFEHAGSIGTTALYLATLWDNEVNATYKSWVRPFFGKYYCAQVCSTVHISRLIRNRARANCRRS
jgi:hypothetical protein